MHRDLLVFPSPCGEKVGVTAGPPRFGKGVQDSGFPSPCGEKVGVTVDGVALAASHFVVSVPLRGKGRCDPSPD